MKRMLLGIGWMIFFLARPALAQSYEFAVEHEHTFRNCQGRLVITPDKIEYQTDHQSDARAWRYDELRQIKVQSPTRVELVSYEDRKRWLGRDRIFKFRVLEGELTSEVSALLVRKATRPLVASVMPATEDAPAFEVPVKHLHRFGGCLGALRIYPDRVVYESQEMPSDSRYWRYGDIQSFSQSEHFRFELVSFEEKFGGPKAYNFQLREVLPVPVYDYVWARVYPSRLRRDERLAQPVAGNRPAVRQ
jgi:hypothetical protein